MEHGTWNMEHGTWNMEHSGTLHNYDEKDQQFGGGGAETTLMLSFYDLIIKCN